MKLEQPAIAHFVGNLISEWRPHMFVDGHDGGAQAPTQTLEVGARAGYLGYLAVVQFAADHADRLMGVVASARRNDQDGCGSAG